YCRVVLPAAVNPLTIKTLEGSVHMKRFAMTIGVLILLGCTHSTVLVNPKTGERVTCRAPTDRSGIVAIDPTGRRENCVQQHEAAGFVQADNLTPEQRTNLNSTPQTVTIERR